MVVVMFGKKTLNEDRTLHEGLESAAQPAVGHPHGPPKLLSKLRSEKFSLPFKPDRETTIADWGGAGTQSIVFSDA